MTISIENKAPTKTNPKLIPNPVAKPKATPSKALCEIESEK